MSAQAESIEALAKGTIVPEARNIVRRYGHVPALGWQPGAGTKISATID
ncbi:MAG: hypothetical protein JO298_05025 [Verrucomicrobia bacterium]|nr:hypothetical protein [Verrucomicrobiota bacterium]